MASEERPMLRLDGIDVSIQSVQVLRGLSFEVGTGKLVGLVGRNGAGKTTTMRAIMGLLRKRAGSISYQGTETIALAPNNIARLGIAYCPEERGIFSSLNVRENLLLPPVVLPGGMSVDEIHELFPRLEERLNSHVTKLSGC
jgi:branched-chain amino acid transport system ATP-binding protein